MEEDANFDISESTEEIEDKSLIELEYDKADTESALFCHKCNFYLKNNDEFSEHNLNMHPIFIYKCNISECSRWFLSKKNRDKHSENNKIWLHRSIAVKKPPSNSIAIENASQDQIEAIYKASQYKRRGPKPKAFCLDNDMEYLVGMPKEQLKRKLMESVTEKIDYLPPKKTVRDDFDEQKTDNSDVPDLDPSLHDKDEQEAENISENDACDFLDLSYLKVSLIEIDLLATVDEYVMKLFSLLELNDPANYFKFPFIEDFAPESSKIENQMFLKSIKSKYLKKVYCSNISKLKEDLLSIYFKGIKCYVKNSDQWITAAKLYQIVKVNLERHVLQRFNSSNIHTSESKEDTDMSLSILNPYNTGENNSQEKIISIGDQVETSKNNYLMFSTKDDKRNKLNILTYLDYGTNFSFGPIYDSGNSSCTKDINDLLLRNYEKSELNDLNLVSHLFSHDNSNFSIEKFTSDTVSNYKTDFSENKDKESEINCEESLNDVQNLLNISWKNLKLLKYQNYKRLANHNTNASNEELISAGNIISNLRDLISKAAPKDVMNNHCLRKYLTIQE